MFNIRNYNFLFLLHHKNKNETKLNVSEKRTMNVGQNVKLEP